MNLIEILENVPKGTKFYSPAFGDVVFLEIYFDKIRVKDSCNIERLFYSNGSFYKNEECVLFPSRENRNWNTFKKFDIITLKPFDKVLARDTDINVWVCKIYSHYSNTSNYRYVCTDNSFIQCIPYNDETKHLVSTKQECPEYYKNW